MKNNWQVKKIGEALLFVLLTGILLAPFFYIYIYRPDRNFWDNAVGNLLATVLALIAGIPIALWVDRFVKKQEVLNQFKVDRIKEKEILTLIKEELDYSYTTLFLQGKKGNTTTMVIQPLKSDLWDALVASEEVKYIEGYNLLNRVASAYYVLKLVKDIEKQAYIALRTSAITFTNTQGVQQNAAQLLLQDARTFDTLFENSIKEALRVINKRLKVLKNYEN